MTFLAQLLSSKKQNSLIDLSIQNQKGFSLIEILIALTLLALAGTFVAGKIFDNLHEGQVSSAKIQMQNISERLKEFRRHCGQYPTTEQGLKALVEKPSGSPECTRWNPEGYIEGGKVPQDPWEEEFVYESDGRKFNVYSLGPDKAEGGEGKDADIFLFEKAQQ